MDTVLQIASMIGAPAIISGVVIWMFSRKISKADAKAACRHDETVLILRGLLSIGGLASATARGLVDREFDGHVTAALDDYTEYRGDLEAYLVNNKKPH